MSYNYITKYDSPNYGQIYGPVRLPVDVVTIHWWGSPCGQNPYGIINYLCRANGNSSAHAVIWPGNVACIVNYDRAAWHSGDPTGNQTSIGLELDPNHIEQTIPTAAEFIADLVRKGIVARSYRLVGHRDWPQASTECPGAYHGRLGEIKARADAILAGAPTPKAPAPAGNSSSSDEIDRLADAVYRGEYGNEPERSRRLGAKAAAVQARVNEKYYGIKTPAPSGNSFSSDEIDRLADAVYRGEYGNEPERSRRLGAKAAAVQKRVNEKYYGIK